ncbi:hypothetical protein NMG60_11005343 [Bertholletia excelsa]
MDRTLSPLDEREPIKHNHQNHLRPCLPSSNLRNSKYRNPFSLLVVRVSKAFTRSHYGARFPDRFCFRRPQFKGMVVNNYLYCVSPCSVGENMEGQVGNYEIQASKEKKNEIEGFNDGIKEGFSKSNSSSSEFLVSETTLNEEQSRSSSEDSSSPPSVGWPAQKPAEAEKRRLAGRKLEKQGSSFSEIEMIKQRFSKLLLGEDMSGSGNGVCPALAISNAITNLCATLFGQVWRLEPLPPEKKSTWRREIEWLICVSDHIVELTPSWQTLPDGSRLEVMTSRPRSDLYVNLPALRKLDNMLLEILDSFINMEFWYVDQGILAPDADGSSSCQQSIPRQEEKWWLPVPRVPSGGLRESSRKQLQHKRDSANQILKAAMAINSITLADMEVPHSYLENLPKNGKACLGDFIHQCITSEQFSPECLLDCLDISSEHQAMEIANRVEASIYVWHRRTNQKPLNSSSRSNLKSSWEMVKDLVIDGDKRELLAERADSLSLCLKQRFPGLPQTTLDMSKIQYNKDVGRSILESYSRVLESLAFNIVARIDDLLYVDDLMKHSDQFTSISKVGVIARKGVGIPCSVPILSTPYNTAFTTPSFSPAQRVSPSKGERSPYHDANKLSHQGFGVKKVLTDYLTIDMRGKDSLSSIIQETSAAQCGLERSDSLSNIIRRASTSQNEVECIECSKEVIIWPIHDSVWEE